MKKTIQPKPETPLPTKTVTIPPATLIRWKREVEIAQKKVNEIQSDLNRGQFKDMQTLSEIEGIPDGWKMNLSADGSTIEFYEPTE